LLHFQASVQPSGSVSSAEARYHKASSMRSARCDLRLEQEESLSSRRLARLPLRRLAQE
jgi:hypothetical protein